MNWKICRKFKAVSLNILIDCMVRDKPLRGGGAGLAVSIWTGAWHIARHINLGRAIKKRRKFHSETKIQSLAMLSCTTDY